MSGISNIPGAVPGQNYDPKSLALVDKLIEKTKEGKIRWAKAKSKDNEDAAGFAAVLYSHGTQEMTMQIAFGASGMLTTPTWLSFNVTTKNDGVILNVQNTSVPIFIAKLAGIKPDALREKIDQLFNLVAQRGEGSFERALKQLDNL